MTDLRLIARCVLMLASAATSSAALAQAIAPSAAASAAAERAQKETDRTMYWIRVLAATPAPKAPKAAAAAPAPRVAAAPAPAPVKVAAAPTQTAPAPSSADIANATPAPVVAAAPAPAPSLAATNGTAGNGNSTAMTTGGADAGVASAGVAAGIAAPAATAAQVDIPPVEEEPDPGLIMTKSADPQFPVAAMKRLRKGEVEVKFEVNPDGVVDSVSVLKTSNPGLNASAMDAVRQWRFKPTPKAHTAAVALAFNLDQ